MKFRKAVLIFFLCILPGVSLKAQIDLGEQPSDLIAPYNTDLVKKDVTSDDTCVITRYKYSSRLSEKEIVAFYRDYFSSQGLKEQRIVDLVPEENTDIPGQLKIAIVFKKGILKTAILSIYYYDEEEGTTFYSLNETQMKYAVTLSDRFIVAPQKLSFMPVYKEATQLAPLQAAGKRQGVSYLIKGDVAEVVNFYLKEMPAFKWQLTASYPHKGTRNVYKTLTAGTDFREALARTPKEMFGDMKVNIEGNNIVYETGGKKFFLDTENMMPDVEATIEGTTLIFEKDNNRKCIININQFQDPRGVLQELKIVNPVYLEKYGNILLGVSYLE